MLRNGNSKHEKKRLMDTVDKLIEQTQRPGTELGPAKLVWTGLTAPKSWSDLDLHVSSAWVPLPRWCLLRKKYESPVQWTWCNMHCIGEKYSFLHGMLYQAAVLFLSLSLRVQDSDRHRNRGNEIAIFCTYVLSAQQWVLATSLKKYCGKSLLHCGLIETQNILILSVSDISSPANPCISFIAPALFCLWNALWVVWGRNHQPTQWSGWCAPFKFF